MRLIGMLDSPYTRRVAISLKFLNVPFEHEPVSVFSQYDSFAATNPVVKAPTFVTDSGCVLMDSSLILEYAERVATEDRSLTPREFREFERSQRIIGLALAATDKAVQLVYERSLRPQEKQHLPWSDRVKRQLTSACRLLENEITSAEGWLVAIRPMQADVTTAVAWSFMQSLVPDAVPAGDYPRLCEFTARAEALPEFRSTPMN